MRNGKKLNRFFEGVYILNDEELSLSMNSKTRQAYLEQLVKSNRRWSSEGKVARYIPELQHASPDLLGITVQSIGGEALTAGDCAHRFTLQSISKVFTLIMALMDRGEETVFSKVGMEPTGDMYNSMMKLELVTPGKPFNPMINAGAIVVTSLIAGKDPEHQWSRILDFFREMTNDQSISLNETVYRSEAETGNRNRALAWLLKDNRILEGDPEQHLHVYFKHCAVEVHCSHLARMGMILANDGTDPETGRNLIPRRFVQIAKTFMVTAGMYNASGEFAIRVGLPAKSGVSGGIVAVVPGKMGIGVVGPALDDKGNSIAGIHMLEQLSNDWGLSMF